MFTRRNLVITIVIATIAISAVAVSFQDFSNANVSTEQHASDRDFTPDWNGFKRLNDHQVADLTDLLPDQRYICTGRPEPIVIDEDEFEGKVSRVTDFTPDQIGLCSGYANVEFSADAIAMPVDVGVCDRPDCIWDPIDA